MDRWQHGVLVSLDTEHQTILPLHCSPMKETPSASQLLDLQGQIGRVTYTKDENGYTIAKVKVSGLSDLVTGVGSIMAPTPGEIFKMKGEWATHPKYGE